MIYSKHKCAVYGEQRYKAWSPDCSIQKAQKQKAKKLTRTGQSFIKSAAKSAAKKHSLPITTFIGHSRIF